MVVRALDIGANMGVHVERTLTGLLFISFLALVLYESSHVLRRTGLHLRDIWRRPTSIAVLYTGLALIASGAVTWAAKDRAMFADAYGPFTVWPSVVLSSELATVGASISIGRLLLFIVTGLLLGVAVLLSLERKRRHGGWTGALGLGGLGVTACPACGLLPIITGGSAAVGLALFTDPTAPAAALLDIASVLGPLAVVTALGAPPTTPSGLGRRGNGLLFAGISLPLVYAVLGMPEGASERQAATHDLFIIATIGAVFLVLIVFIMLFGFTWKYRDGRDTDQDHHLSSGARRWIQVLYIGVPALVIFGIGGLSYAVLLEHETPPDDVHEIDVVANQFSWRFTYPDGTTSMNELRVRAGDAVRLNLSSSDVIHSLFIPDMGIKIDAMPGVANHAWFRPLEAGTYPAYCVEYCGVGHAVMEASVVVHPEDGPRPSGAQGTEGS